VSLAAAGLWSVIGVFGGCSGSASGVGDDTVTGLDQVDVSVGVDVATDGSAQPDTADTAHEADTGGGGCSPACAAGRVCGGSACVCAPGLTDCGGDCVDLDRDPDNCHACGHAAEAELCNGEDDDCDGEIDDGLTPPSAPCEVDNIAGVCAGSWSCDGTGWSCDAATPQPERCNGEDDDCDGDTDEDYRDAVSGAYTRDDACGDCATDCTALLAAPHAYGRCDASGGAPTCEMVCCTAEDGNPACDGFDYVDTNGDGANGCEDRVAPSCSVQDDCDPGQFCDAGACAPNEAGGPCTTDANCAAGDQCFDGICGCQGDVYSAESVPPNVLVVLDRSGSMNSSAGGGQGTKWNIAKGAIATLTEAYDGQIRFGLMLYPGTNQAGNNGQQCGAGVVFIDPALDNADAIVDFLDDAGTTTYGTPTAEALEALVDYPGLEDAGRQNFVVLITDGQSSCGDPVPEVTALAGESPAIPTFVIGFGGGVDPDELDDMADAGGTALSGEHGYYVANDAESLGQALADVAGNVLGCDFALGATPPSLEALGVYFDQVVQPRDPTHSDGWDYTAATNTITFYGSRCDALKAGDVGALSFVYGCVGGTIGD